MTSSLDYRSVDSIDIKEWMKDKTLEDVTDEINQILSLQMHLNDILFTINDEIKERTSHLIKDAHRDIDW